MHKTLGMLIWIPTILFRWFYTEYSRKEKSQLTTHQVILLHGLGTKAFTILFFKKLYDNSTLKSLPYHL